MNLSLQNYINKNIQYYNNINESIENNVRMINEAKLIREHGKDIDTLLYKFKTYTHNNLYNYNNINESDNTYKLSLNEQETFRDLMIFICEEYRDKLLTELNIYESLIIDGELLTEGKFIDKLKDKSKNLTDNIKATWQLGKDKVNQAIESIKIKVKEVNELIKDYATKAIKSVKEMASKLVELLVKFDCTLEGLFEKMGFDIKKEAESVNDISNEIAANPDYIKKNDVYESYANTLNIINEEGEENENIKDKGETQKQGEKHGVKQMLWEGFKQFMIWAGVCVILPGFIVGLFPGTFIALIVPIACKLLWNAYKIVKLVKQWKKVKQEWGTYSKVQKILVAGGMIASIIAIVFNFGSIANSIGKIWEAFTKSGCDLLAEANCGVQPDVLQRGFGAIVKMIKEGKFSFQDFQQSFKDITDSFAEIIPQADKAVKVTAQIGKSGKDLLDEYGDKTFKSSTKAWTEFLKPSGMEPNKIDPKVVYDVVMDGSQDAKWFAKLSKFASDNGVSLKPDKGFNAGLNKLCSNAGSITGAKLPGWLIKKAMDEGINIGNKGLFSILGGIIETTQNVPVEDIVNAASSMLVTIPSVEFAPQNNGGFRVRLGGKDDKDNFVYEVSEDGVKKHKVSDYQKEYDKIKEKIAEVNKKFLRDLLKNDKLSDEDKNNIKKDLEEFESNYKEKINTEDCIVFYGTLYSKKTNESFRSLYDYIINENDTIETSNKKDENELEDANKPLADEQNNNDSNKEENNKTDNTDEKEVPILLIANNYGIDIASATKSGPREDAYALKGIFDSLTFGTFEGGTSVDNIAKMLGDILCAQTNNLLNISANRPCNKDKKGKKFILNDKFNKDDDERPDFGMLTNQEITDILNKPENAIKLIKGKSNKNIIVQTEEDKKLQDEKKNEFKDKLENPDEETVKLVKEIDPNLVDKDGKIKNINNVSDTLSSYYLAKYKADKSRNTKKSSGGFFTKIKNFVKSLFGGNKDEGKKYNNLLKHLDESLNESIYKNLNEYDNFLNDCFERLTLSEYIIFNNK